MNEVAQVIWNRLSLSGFGRYQSTASIELGSALSVLVAPNESGKTTLIAGLTAVLFGLPAIQDPTQFSQARFRNWQHPPHFAGELCFQVGAESWHLQRDFATNRISLRQCLGNGWREVVQGVDNPAARRPFQRYHEQLRRLIGIDRRELFQVTFCLTQPLPTPEGLDEAVQTLLSGADSRVDRIQDMLSQQVKSITRYYGDALGGGRGGNKDRKLEEVETAIRSLEQEIAASRQAADGLQAVQASLGQLEQQRADVSRQLQAAEQLFNAWAAWRSHQERYQRQLSEQQQLQPAVERAKELESRLEQSNRGLQQYADMAAAGGDWSQRLQRLSALQVERQSDQLALEQAQLEVVTLQEEQADLVAKLRPAPGESPETISPANNARCQEQQARVERLQQRLQTEFGQFEQAEAVQLVQLADYHRRHQELVARQREAEQACAMLFEREQAYLHASESWSQKYGPLRQEAERLLGAIDAHIQNNGGRSSRRQMPSPLVPWLVALSASLVTFGLWGRTVGAVGIGGSLVAGLISWFAAKFLAGERSPNRAGAKRAAAGLGQLAALSWPDLLTARSLLESLSRAQAERPGAELAMAESARQEARADLAAWQQALHLFIAAFSDPGAAYRQWNELRQQLALATQDLVAITEGMQLGAERELQSRLAVTESRLERVLQQQSALSSRVQAHQGAWEEQLTAIALPWQIAGDLEALKQRHAVYHGLQQENNELAQAQSELLKACGVKALPDLQRRLLDLQNNIAAGQMRWQDLIDQHPGLPGVHEADQAEHVHALFLTSEARVLSLRQATDQLRERLEQLWRQQARLMGQEPCNVAQAEDRLRQLTAERDHLQLEVAALGLAFRELAVAKEDYETAYRDSLAAQATTYFDRITGEQGRSVELGPDFKVTVRTADGKSVLPAQLSQGARDQLYFSLRLAIADLLADQSKLPFILDDPFLNSDAERLQRIRQALVSAAEERQIWLFTHQEQFADWGESVSLQLGQ